MKYSEIKIKKEDVSSNMSGTNDSTEMFLNEKDSQSHKEVIKDFILFCKKYLKIAKLPKVTLKKDAEWSSKHKTFGYYNPNDNSLTINLAGRNLMDILRTVGHELVHCKQFESVDMPIDAGETGSAAENHANSVAGILMREYGQLHPELFQMPVLSESIDKLNEILDRNLKTTRNKELEALVNQMDQTAKGHTAVLATEKMADLGVYVVRFLDKTRCIQYHISRINDDQGKLNPLEQDREIGSSALNIIFNDAQHYLTHQHAFPVKILSPKERLGLYLQLARRLASKVSSDLEISEPEPAVNNDGEDVYAFTIRYPNSKGNILEKMLNSGSTDQFKIQDIKDRQELKEFLHKRADQIHSLVGDSSRATLISKKFIDVIRENDEPDEYANWLIDLIQKETYHGELKIGDEICTAFLDIIKHAKEAYFFGSSEPLAIKKFVHNSDGSLNYLILSDGSRFPRVEQASYQGNHLMHMLITKDKDDLTSTIMLAQLKKPEDWTLEVVLDNKAIMEASGYIPTAAQAHDPRFEMALSCDVHPGTLGKVANAFDLNTDSQGKPQIANPNGRVVRENCIEEQTLFESWQEFEHQDQLTEIFDRAVSYDSDKDMIEKFHNRNKEYVYSPFTDVVQSSAMKSNNLFAVRGRNKKDKSMEYHLVSTRHENGKIGDSSQWNNEALKDAMKFVIEDATNFINKGSRIKLMTDDAALYNQYLRIAKPMTQRINRERQHGGEFQVIEAGKTNSIDGQYLDTILIRGTPTKKMESLRNDQTKTSYTPNDINKLTFESFDHYRRWCQSPKTNSNRNPMFHPNRYQGIFIDSKDLLEANDIFTKRKQQAREFSNEFLSLDDRENVALKVGNKISVLSCIVAPTDKISRIELSGFVTPKEIANLLLSNDDKIDAIEFTDGTQYPEKAQETIVDNINLVNTIFFPDKHTADYAMTAIELLLWGMEGKGWKIERYMSESADNLEESLWEELQNHKSGDNVNNFQKWFGNSKVVDDNGNPLRVYHGTASDFPSFSSKFQGKTTGATSSKSGFFFTSSPTTAKSYADYAALNAKVQQILDQADAAEKKGDWDLYDEKIQQAEELDASFDDPKNRAQGQSTIPVFLSIQNPMILDAQGENPAGIGGIDPLIRKAKARGHDGVIIKNFDDSAGLFNDVSDHYVVFNANQIKSAIGNKGSYNPDSDEIVDESISMTGEYNKVLNVVKRSMTESVEEFVSNFRTLNENNLKPSIHYQQQILEQKLSKNFLDDFNTNVRFEEMKYGGYYDNAGNIALSFDIVKRLAEAMVKSLLDWSPEPGSYDDEGNLIIDISDFNEYDELAQDVYQTRPHAVKELVEIFIHEYVHREQHKRIGHKNAAKGTTLPNQYRSYLQRNKELFARAIQNLDSDEDWRAYLSSPQEITSHAHDLANRLIQGALFGEQLEDVGPDAAEWAIKSLKNTLKDASNYQSQPKYTQFNVFDKDNAKHKKIVNRFLKTVYQEVAAAIQTLQNKVQSGNLSESLGSPYPLNQGLNLDSVVSYTWKDENNLKGSIGFMRGGYDEDWEITFNVGGKFNITNKGDAFRIFATAKDAVKRFMTAPQGKGADRVYFSAKTSEPTRVKLYDKLAQMMVKNGFKLHHTEMEGNQKYYYFDTPNQGKEVKESLDNTLLEVLKNPVDHDSFNDLSDMINTQNKGKAMSGHTNVMATPEMKEENTYIIRFMDNDRNIQYHICTLGMDGGQRKKASDVDPKIGLDALNIIFHDAKFYLEKKMPVLIIAPDNKRKHSYLKMATLLKNQVDSSLNIEDVGMITGVDGARGLGFKIVETQFNKLTGIDPSLAEAQTVAKMMPAVKLWKARVKIKQQNYTGYVEATVTAPDMRTARNMLKALYNVPEHEVGSVTLVK